MSVEAKPHWSVERFAKQLDPMGDVGIILEGTDPLLRSAERAPKSLGRTRSPNSRRPKGDAAAEPRPTRRPHDGVGLGFTIGRKTRKLRGKRDRDLDWATGLPIPDTLDHWLLQAFKRHVGVVLTAAKVREAVERLGLRQPVARAKRDLVVP